MGKINRSYWQWPWWSFRKRVVENLSDWRLSEDFKYVFMFRLKLSVIFLSLRPSRSPWIPGQHYRSGKSGILGPEMARAVKYLKITWFSECSHKNVTKSDDKNEFIHFQKRDESWLVFALVSSFISTAKSVSILHRLVSLELLKSKMRMEDSSFGWSNTFFDWIKLVNAVIMPSSRFRNKLNTTRTGTVLKNWTSYNCTQQSLQLFWKVFSVANNFLRG